VSLFIFEDSDAEARARFGLEPSRLGRHDHVGIGNIHELVDRARVKCDCRHTVQLTTTLQFFVSSNASNKINAVVLFKICNFKNRPEYEISQDLGVKLCNRSGFIE
jgi:hypothetical protein